MNVASLIFIAQELVYHLLPDPEHFVKVLREGRPDGLLLSTEVEPPVDEVDELRQRRLISNEYDLIVRLNVSVLGPDLFCSHLRGSIR